MTDKIRLDAQLVALQLCPSRQKAKECIEDGFVLVNNSVVTKPSFSVSSKDAIVCKKIEKYVGRGGYKLEAILSDTNYVNNQIVLDVGASTGGFTQCALEFGAKKVYAVDVGHDQLHESLKNDDRVVNLEKTDIRNRQDLLIIQDKEIDFCCIDVSFISLSLVVPAIIPMLKDSAIVACLIKPQFEVGKSFLNKNGIVKEPKAHISCIRSILKMLMENGLCAFNLLFSPITGGDGNIEYLVLSKKSFQETELGETDIQNCVDTAFQSLKRKE